MSTNIVIDNSQGGIESGGADVTLPVNPTVGGALVASSTSSYVTHLAAHTMRNRLINGAHMVSQRNGDRLIEPLEGVSSTLPTYTTDRWIATENTAVGRSAYFDGSGDYLSVPRILDTSGDVTIECWVYLSANPTATGAWLINQYLAADAGRMTLYITSSRTVGMQFGATAVTGTTTISLNAWSHLAWVRSGGAANNFKMYINGVFDAQNTYTGSFTNTPMTIGGEPTVANSWLNGYMSNVRVLEGTALYTANFTPSTSPLLPVAGTSLLACASKDIRKDKSSNDFVLTANGNAAISLGSPYGDGFSNYFDGSGDYLSIANNAALQFGSGDFTFETWFYIAADSTPDGFGNRNATILTSYVSSPETQLTIQIDGNASTTGTGITFGFYTGGAWALQVVRSATINKLQWHHLAATRSGSTVRVFLNGTQLGADVTSSSNIIPTGPFEIGRFNFLNQNRFINGYISNLRIVKGTALYTANFTPSTTPLAAVSGAGYSTSLLTCASRRFEDKSSNNFAITPAGNVAVYSAPPFINTQHGGTFLAGRSAGWSNYFDGSGDYLSVADNAAFDLSSGDFTIEAWFNLNQLPTNGIAYSLITQWASPNAWLTSLYNNAGTYQLFFAYSTTGSDTVSLPVNLSSAPIVNRWYHVAYVRSGTNFRVYLDGTQVGATQTINATIFNATSSILIGAQQATPTGFINGYISNLRIVKGTALYTANFTPSTTPLIAVPNTSLLTCASENFEDKSSNNFAITKNGDVTVRTMSPFSHMPTGFSRALQWSVTKPATATAAEHAHIQQRVEGSNIYDLAWGTADAKAATLSFWVRSPVTGTYCVAVQNSARDRSYVAEYTVSAANTWEKKSVTIPGPTTGTWNTNTSEGLRVVWDLGSGTDFSGAAGSWLSANDTRTANQTNFVGTALASGVQSNDFMVTGAQFELGSAATAFESMPANAEVSLCQRYYARLRSLNGNYVGFGVGTARIATDAACMLYYPAVMRSSPAISFNNVCLFDTSAKLITGNLETNASQQSARIYPTVASGLTATYGVVMCGNNDPNASVELNAEL